jgi:hypothetical protein
MRTAPSISFRFSTRVVPLVALCAALVSCEDATAPESVATGNPASLSLSQSSNDQLAQLGDDMDTMTGWSLVNLPDDRGRLKLVGLLNSLKAHLTAGKISACQDDVNDARSFLQSLTVNEQVELGGIGVTLDVVENAINNT